MLHCDDEDLSLIALGEPMDPIDESHLQECSRCHSRLDQLRAVVSSARSITDDDRPVAPPDAVWSAITAELGTASTATVTSLDEARSARRPRIWIVSAAAAIIGLVVGGVVTAGALNAPTTQDVVAEAALAPVDDSGLTGTASVETGVDGAVLTVSVPGLPPVDDGYYEVWMATADTATMVAIGTLGTGTDAHFSLPPGMDLGSFPVVDVSLEHFDGDAGHSAVSVVRGSLRA